MGYESLMPGPRPIITQKDGPLVLYHLISSSPQMLILFLLSKRGMLAALRSRALPSLFSSSQTWKLGFHRFLSSASADLGYLELHEVEKILNDVKADDVRVIPVKDQCDWTDFMVIATGRSTWHVRNIAQALVYKVKLKQRELGNERMLLPSVQGHQTGNWIVIDSGKVIVHALDENARAYYNLESLWTKERSKDDNQDLERALVKIRPKNNSKKRVQKNS